MQKKTPDCKKRDQKEATELYRRVCCDAAWHRLLPVHAAAAAAADVSGDADDDGGVSPSVCVHAAAALTPKSAGYLPAERRLSRGDHRHAGCGLVDDHGCRDPAAAAVYCPLLSTTTPHGCSTRRVLSDRPSRRGR